jgi:putative ABC transport system permease protein
MRFFELAEDRIAALPAVRAVEAISFLPLTGFRANNGFDVDGRRVEPDSPVADSRAVTTGYFRTMGIAIEEGRSFERADVANSPSVAVVSRSLARRFWPTSSAIGHYLEYEWMQKEHVRIVGVAEDVRESAAPPSHPTWRSTARSGNSRIPP